MIPESRATSGLSPTGCSPETKPPNTRLEAHLILQLWHTQLPGNKHPPTTTSTCRPLAGACLPEDVPEIQPRWFQTRPRRVVSQSRQQGVFPSHRRDIQRSSSAREGGQTAQYLCHAPEAAAGQGTVMLQNPPNVRTCTKQEQTTKIWR